MENLKKLSNQEIEFKTMNLVKEERNNICSQLMYLAEINIRNIPQASFCFNIGDYCRRRLGMTKNQAWKRSQAVRVIQFFPKLLGLLRNGETTLTNVGLLSSHITQANEESILQFLLSLLPSANTKLFEARVRIFSENNNTLWRNSNY